MSQPTWGNSHMYSMVGATKNLIFHNVITSLHNVIMGGGGGHL